MDSEEADLVRDLNFLFTFTYSNLGMEWAVQSVVLDFTQTLGM
jgi:hypothetical protein